MSDGEFEGRHAAQEPFFATGQVAARRAVPSMATRAYELHPASVLAYDTKRSRKTTVLPGRAGSGGRLSSTAFSVGKVWSASRMASSSAGMFGFVSPASEAVAVSTANSIVASRRCDESGILMLDSSVERVAGVVAR